MLKSLYVKNYALIDEADINFAPGLNIITGETGAGKSIMLGAIGLIMGNRADIKALADQSGKCIVEAKYDVTSLGLQAYFEENDLEYHTELIVRREVLPSGKSRAFINDSPVTLDVLQELSDGLLDLHQQFDTLDLYKSSFQIRVLDALANNSSLLDQYRAALSDYKKISQKLEELEKNRKQASAEYDFVKYQLDEVLNLKLENEEFETLEEELEVLLSSEDIKATSMLIYKSLDGEEKSMNTLLSDLVRQAQHLAPRDKRFAELGDRLASCLEEFKDIASESEDIFEKTEFDEKRINYVQDRIASIHKLLKKHQMNSSKELLDLIDDLASKLTAFDHLDVEIEQSKAAIALAVEHLSSLSTSLSEKRKGIIPQLKSGLLAVLMELAMPSADFDVVMKHAESFGEVGNDLVEFMFSANKGGRMLPLKQVASGGETSRFALALKSIIAKSMHLSTMIFDEIDTGVSGEVAHKMGLIMQELSKTHQIIIITHSPQIAAKGDLHLFVYKVEGENKTSSLVKALDKEARVVELSKMLSGDKPSEAAIANARSLLGV